MSRSVAPTHAVVFLNCVCIVQASPKSVTFNCFTLNEKINHTPYSNDEVTRTFLLSYVCRQSLGNALRLRVCKQLLYGKTVNFFLSFLQLISCFKCTKKFKYIFWKSIKNNLENVLLFQ